MSKHTPGPWNCDEVRTQVGRAFRIGSGEMLAAGKGCCIIYDDYPGNPDNERAANARLIAAAPDLLDILKAILRLGDLENVSAAGPHWHGGGKKPPTKDVFAFPRHMLTDIEAVISKATGGADV